LKTTKQIDLNRPNPLYLTKKQEILIQKEIEEMLEKGAIQQAQPTVNQFLSSIFLVPKKDGGNRPVINLKKLNEFIPYQHFKMEGLHSLQSLMEQDD